MLEYYTCTEIEKQALRDKIKYNGMTVGTIGKIEDFTDSTVEEIYIKGLNRAFDHSYNTSDAGYIGSLLGIGDIGA